MMVVLGYMGIDQYGDTYHIGNNPPRKWLLNHLCRRHADKMYVDSVATGQAKHIGYIIAGRWITLYRVSEWIGKVT